VALVGYCLAGPLVVSTRRSSRSSSPSYCGASFQVLRRFDERQAFRSKDEWPASHARVSRSWSMDRWPAPEWGAGSRSRLVAERAAPNLRGALPLRVGVAVDSDDPGRIKLGREFLGLTEKARWSLLQKSIVVLGRHRLRGHVL